MKLILIDAKDYSVGENFCVWAELTASRKVAIGMGSPSAIEVNDGEISVMEEDEAIKEFRLYRNLGWTLTYIDPNLDKETADKLGIL